VLLRNETFASLLLDEEAIATPLLVGLLDEFGTEMLDWEPETLRLEIKNEWKVTPPQVNFDKIWALVTVLTTNSFYDSFEGFTHICNALSNTEASFDVYDPADVTEMAWAIAECTLLDPPDPTGKDKSYQFNTEIIAYMQARLNTESFSKPPLILAKHLPENDGSAKIDSALADDGIDYNAYWDSQQRKRMAVDRWVGSRMLNLIQTLVGLPLQNADKEALAQLQERARKALAAQAQEIQSASATVAPAPTF
jgi:hypothetical protein